MIYFKLTDSRSKINFPCIVPLTQRIFLIGRYRTNPEIIKPLHLYLKDSSVSSFHCYLIRPCESGVLVDDYTIFDGKLCTSKYSKHGIFINEERVRSKRLKDGDIITIGSYYKLIYKNENEDAIWKKTQ